VQERHKAISRLIVGSTAIRLLRRRGRVPFGRREEAMSARLRILDLRIPDRNFDKIFISRML
jgi:hypothetical protein